MPVPLRTGRAETKYNVTTDFPHLGLHSAAATGNVGLVQYALSHGQPINSVLDGVLPLHAACSGGNDLVVRLLIEHGADVNAPRLPRRYSNDKHRDTSAPIVGTSGSTPLHFAAANGHANVVLTLLQYGADPDRADKHGVYPENVARQNGWIECASLLQNWHANKDRDSVDKEGGAAKQRLAHQSSREKLASIGIVPEGSMRNRLHAKRSVEQPLTLLKTSPHCRSESHLVHTNLPPNLPDLPPPPAGKPLGEYSFYPVSDNMSTDAIFNRRPSLPHIQTHTPPKTHRGYSKRPTSAGTGAEQGAPESSNRKLNSKYSLLNIFKKPGGDSTSPSPARQQERMPSSQSQLPSSSHADYVQSGSGFSNQSLAQPQPPFFPYRHQNGSETSLRSSGYPSAVDLHNALAIQPTRERSGSSDSRQASTLEEGSPSSRPSILRAHNRSSSSNHSHSPLVVQSPYRTLRFDASTTSLTPSKLNSGNSRSDLRNPNAPNVMRSSSISSLRFQDGTNRTADEGVRRPTMPGSLVDGEDEIQIDIEEEEEYGELIPPPAGRPRIRSFNSLSSSASQAVLTPDDSAGSEFPFTQPAQQDDLNSQHLIVPHPADHRSRGDSVSSISTDGSCNPQLSFSGTTGLSSNGSAISPTSFTAPHSPPSKRIEDPLELPRGSDRDGGLLFPGDNHSLGLSQRRAHTPVDIKIKKISSHAQAEELVQRAQQCILETSVYPDETLPLSAKLAAYGESLALERRLKREEDERAGIFVTPKEGVEATGSDDRIGSLNPSPSPSSRLGQSYYSITSPRTRVERRGLDRKLSLEHSSEMNRTSRRRREPKRPNTGGGAPDSMVSRRAAYFRPDDHPNGFHQPSHSASGSDIKVDSTYDPPPAFLPPQKSSPLSNGDGHPNIDTTSFTRSVARHTPGYPDELKSSGSRDEFTTPVGSRNTEVDFSENHRLDHARHIASANKLTRMGFSANEGWQPSTVSTTTATTKSRFGGLKSLVQSLKGKT